MFFQYCVIQKCNQAFCDNSIACSAVWIRNQLHVTFVLSFISLLQVARHVSGNRVPIIRSRRLRNLIATCWFRAVGQQLPKMGKRLHETCRATCKREIKDNTEVTSSRFFLSTLNYDARSTAHQTCKCRFQHRIDTVRCHFAASEVPRRRSRSHLFVDDRNSSQV